MIHSDGGREDDPLLCALLPGAASVSVLEAARRALPPEDWEPSRAALPPLLPLAWLREEPDQETWNACALSLPHVLDILSPRPVQGSWVLPVEDPRPLARARSLLSAFGASGPSDQEGGKPWPIPPLDGFWLGYTAAALGQPVNGGKGRVGALQLVLFSFSPLPDFTSSFRWEISRATWLKDRNE